MKICAVIPAAGRGSRLGLSRPKIFAPLGEGRTIWSVMRDKLMAVADHVHLIVSPSGESEFCRELGEDLRSGRVSLSLQPEPIGMGDAIFCGYPVWSKAETVLVIWGDQVFVSEATLRDSLALHGGQSRTVVLPVTSLPEPYVEYVFSDQGQLTQVLQSREGDVTRAGGYNDVGTFILSVPGVLDLWNTYLLQIEKGSRTNEINFLPFLPLLASQGWSVMRHKVTDAREARGINAPEDLAFFQEIFSNSQNNQ